MTESELTLFCWNLVDGTIEHVFRYFPEDLETRAGIYRKIAEYFNELAIDLETI